MSKKVSATTEPSPSFAELYRMFEDLIELRQNTEEFDDATTAGIGSTRKFGGSNSSVKPEMAKRI
jgi:hypothetical protein